MFCIFLLFTIHTNLYKFERLAVKKPRPGRIGRSYFKHWLNRHCPIFNSCDYRFPSGVNFHRKTRPLNDKDKIYIPKYGYWTLVNFPGVGSIKLILSYIVGIIFEVELSSEVIRILFTK